MPLDGSQTVQHYRISATSEAIFPFYEEEMMTRGWVQASVAYGPAGKVCRWTPSESVVYSDRYIAVSTEYVGRRGSPDSPPPGFQGKGIPFATAEHGFTWYWVISSR
jgi:hypothetical protein